MTFNLSENKISIPINPQENCGECIYVYPEPKVKEFIKLLKTYTIKNNKGIILITYEELDNLAGKELIDNHSPNTSMEVAQEPSARINSGEESIAPLSDGSDDVCENCGRLIDRKFRPRSKYCSYKCKGKFNYKNKPKEAKK